MTSSEQSSCEFYISDQNALFSPVSRFVRKNSAGPIGTLTIDKKFGDDKTSFYDKKFSKAVNDKEFKKKLERTIIPYLGSYEINCNGQTLVVSFESCCSHLQCGDPKRNIILRGPKDVIADFISKSVSDDTDLNIDDSYLKLFQFDSQKMEWIYTHWNKIEHQYDKLLLSQERKDTLVKEIIDFYGDESKRWSEKLGICHNKTYLFHTEVIDITEFIKIVKMLAGICNKNIINSSPDLYWGRAPNHNMFLDDGGIIYYILPPLNRHPGSLDLGDLIQNASNHIIMIFCNDMKMYRKWISNIPIDYEYELIGATALEQQLLLIHLYPELDMTEILDSFITRIRESNAKMSITQFRKLFLQYRTYTGPEMLDEIFEIIKVKYVHLPAEEINPTSSMMHGEGFISRYL